MARPRKNLIGCSTVFVPVRTPESLSVLEYAALDARLTGEIDKTEATRGDEGY